MEFREKIGVNAVRVALAVIARSAMMVAHAQETTTKEATDAKVQRVTITGSNISRIDAEGPTPVEVIQA